MCEDEEDEREGRWLWCSSSQYSDSSTLVFTRVAQEPRPSADDNASVAHSLTLSPSPHHRHHLTRSAHHSASPSVLPAQSSSTPPLPPLLPPAMVQRLTYRRRHGFRTTSNKVRKVRTPGGKLVFQYLTKRSNVPKCGDCGSDLQGIPATRPKIYRTLKKRERRVSRAYGGSICFTCVRQRSVLPLPRSLHRCPACDCIPLSRHASTFAPDRLLAILPPRSSPQLPASRCPRSVCDSSSSPRSFRIICCLPVVLPSAAPLLLLDALAPLFPVADLRSPLCSPLRPLSIVRAFLIEEQKIVKAVLKQRGGKKAAAAAAQ